MKKSESWRHNIWPYNTWHNDSGLYCKHITVMNDDIRVVSKGSYTHTHDVDLAISLSIAISIETLLSFQIAIAVDSDKHVMFYCTCKGSYTNVMWV